MNDVPETTFERIKLSPRKASGRMTAGGVSDLPRCAEGEQLKQQYDFTLQEWTNRSQPQVHPSFAGEDAMRRARLREEALTNRNAAANRMYLHRATCAICRRRR